MMICVSKTMSGAFLVDSHEEVDPPTFDPSLDYVDPDGSSGLQAFACAPGAKVVVPVTHFAADLDAVVDLLRERPPEESGAGAGRQHYAHPIPFAVVAPMRGGAPCPIIATISGVRGGFCVTVDKAAPQREDDEEGFQDSTERLLSGFVNLMQTHAPSRQRSIHAFRSLPEVESFLREALA